MAAFCTRSCCGGVAAGVLWTAQGGYFSTVDLLARREDVERQSLTASLGGLFAAFYLGGEVTAKLTWSALDALKVPGTGVACIFAVVGGLATLLMTRSLDLHLAGPAAKSTNKLKAVASLWKDPVLFLVSGSNLTFGFSAAFMNGYVNEHFTTEQLGSFAAPMLAAFTALLAAILARVYGEVGARIGKAPLVIVGSLSFAAIGLCFFVLSCCDGWGWWLLVLYSLQGSGRAVFESTNKAIFADMFPTEPVGAFSNSMLQSSLAFAMCFFLSNTLKGTTLAIIALSLSALTPCGYFLAVHLRSAQQRRHLLENAA
jgi:MFS family permease